MGQRGPGRKPTELKILQGERRPSRVNLSKPTPRDRPRMPADLSPAARSVWRRQMRAMGPTGVITAADRDCLRAYCEAVVRYEEAARLLAASSPLIQGARSGDLIKNPLHQIVRDNAMLIRLFARELGFLPSAREALHSGGADEDPFAAWEAGAG